jgi:CheY-like chemotaxis protein
MPVIVCTGFSETVNDTNAELLGFSGYLDKPLERQALARAVRDVLDRRSPTAPSPDLS